MMSLGCLPWNDVFARHGAAVALIDAAGRKWSYDQLAEAVQQRSDQLRQAGVGREDKLAFTPGTDLDSWCTFWAVFAVGAVACPLSPRLPASRQLEISNRLAARRLLPDASATTRLAVGEAPPTPTPRDLDDATETLSPPLPLKGPATIVLSSGTLGEPKAVVHLLAAHVANAVGAAANMPLEVGDRWLWSLPAYHVSGLAILVRCVVSGATLVVPPTPAWTGATLAALRITHLSLVPTQLYRLLDEPHGFPSPDLTAVLLGGAATPRTLVEQALSRDVPIHTTYGLTEMASQVTTTAADQRRHALFSCGRVLPGRELTLAGDGEVLVRGETLCQGYARDGRVVSVVDGDGWFHTGDLGRLDDAGHLTITGRRDNMFVSGGENIHPESIEMALVEFCGVRQALVAPREDAEFGARPVAFVDADDWCVESWQAQLRDRLASFEIPIEFIRWPAEGDVGVKPSRAKFTTLANRASQSSRP